MGPGGGGGGAAVTPPAGAPAAPAAVTPPTDPQAAARELAGPRPTGEWTNRYREAELANQHTEAALRATRDAGGLRGTTAARHLDARRAHEKASYSHNVAAARAPAAQAAQHRTLSAIHEGNARGHAHALAVLREQRRGSNR